jgi:hypothetical protein
LNICQRSFAIVFEEKFKELWQSSLLEFKLKFILTQFLHFQLIFSYCGSVLIWILPLLMGLICSISVLATKNLRSSEEKFVQGQVLSYLDTKGNSRVVESGTFNFIDKPCLMPSVLPAHLVLNTPHDVNFYNVGFKVGIFSRPLPRSCGDKEKP